MLFLLFFRFLIFIFGGDVYVGSDRVELGSVFVILLIFCLVIVIVESCFCL